VFYFRYVHLGLAKPSHHNEQ